MNRQAKTEQHGRSRWWMRWLVAVVAVLVLWSVLGLIRDRVPHYRGETAAYFFPKWTRLELWEIEARWPDDAGTDAMPFLINFLARFGHDVDVSLGARLSDLWDELPEAVEKRLPERVSSAMRMHLAIAYLGRVLNTDPEALRVLADRFHELPEYAQGSLLDELPREPSDLNRIRDDLLRRALASQSLELQVPALNVVLQSAEDFNAYLPEFMLAFEAVVAGVPAALSIRFVDRLGAFGPVARPAVPVLERIRRSQHPDLRLGAAMAIARIEHGDAGLLGLLEDPIASEGWPEVQRFLRRLIELSRITQAALPETATQPIWTRLASPEGARDLVELMEASSGGRLGTGTAEVMSRVRVQAFQALSRLRDHHAPALAVVLQGLHDPDPKVTAEALRTLHWWGPVVPETIPDLIAMLPNGAVRGVVVPLLGKYGNQASNAVPALEHLAAGHYPRDWTDREERSDRSIGGGLAMDPEMIHLMLQRYYGIAIPTPTVEPRSAQGLDVPLWLQNDARKALEQIRKHAADLED